MCEMQRGLAYHDSEPTLTNNADGSTAPTDESEGTMRVALRSTLRLLRNYWNPTLADLAHGLVSSLPLV